MYAAVVGVDVEAKPATIKLMLKATTTAGERRQREIPVKDKSQGFSPGILQRRAEFRPNEPGDSR